MSMLEYTFQHISGFGIIKERELWRQNVLTWDDYDTRFNLQLHLNFFETTSILDESRLKLETKEADFFTQRLPSHLFYRVAHTFPENTIFLDIETTGLSRYYDRITVVGWSILDQYKIHIVGDEITKAELLHDLASSNCIVTFNGSIFDIPFLRLTFPEAKIPLCHIDLRFFVRRVDLQGGQKEIEKQLNIKRSKDLIETSGFEATILWHRYKEGDINALKKLIRYNAADIDGMKIIFEKTTRSLIKKDKTPITAEHVFPFSKYTSKPEFSEVLDDRKEKIFLYPYSGKVGPLVFLNELPDLSNHRIVGIDLTGSENRASGWALLEGNIADTKRIFSNQEIIEETIKLKPTIISIDSPLSLPFGRISVYDDDPGRNKYGITRECERTMAKRGVKSYPCLIPSMQKLTERGILLANEFRKRGFAVIESYPGAAQDILGIPRKGKSMEYLVKGLLSFGIGGNYSVVPEISHDEIDAITSALVGYFFLANQYEALGNENEEYLIIPNLNANKNEVPDKRIVIGLSGLLSSGKTTSGEILEDLGFKYGRYSMVIADSLRKEEKEVNRETMQEMGEYVNQVQGQRWLGNELLKMLPSNKNIVIDGLRFPEDHSFLREKFGTGFFHIHLLTDIDKRKNRYYNKPINNINFEIADSHIVEHEVSKLQNFADQILLNNGSIEELKNELKQIINILCQYQ